MRCTRRQIESFTFSINHGGFKPAEQFDSIDNFVTAINAVPDPPPDEEEEEIAKENPGQLAALREQLQEQQKQIGALQKRVSELEK